ncbi:MAG: fructosamine kinase family protein [Tannerella sp.]|jgi:fructosamine-3-kinase|nr:fructosamine kinase family protein [Tannerella sp.]
MNHRITFFESVLGEKIIVFPSHRGCVRTESGRVYFFKSGPESRTFRCEARGLQELASAGAIRAADVVSVGDDYILTCHVDDTRPRNGFFEQFGRALAQLHRHTAASFGFCENNFIGANRQMNVPSETERNDWTTFYFNKRLLYQFRLAERRGYAIPELRKGFARLESKIESILKGSDDLPALLHGDLWSGNFLCDPLNRPVLIDPAVYYGHREAELAMTTLFGGFPQEFYDAYSEAFPLKPGYDYRRDVYTLYHVLNHLNIFGEAYMHEALSLLKRYE